MPYDHVQISFQVPNSLSDYELTPFFCQWTEIVDSLTHHSADHDSMSRVLRATSIHDSISLPIADVSISTRHTHHAHDQNSLSPGSAPAQVGRGKPPYTARQNPMQNKTVSHATDSASVNVYQADQAFSKDTSIIPRTSVEYWSASSAHSKLDCSSDWDSESSLLEDGLIGLAIRGLPASSPKSRR